MLPRFRIIIYALRFNRFLKIDGTNKPVVSMDYLKTLTCAAESYSNISLVDKELLQNGGRKNKNVSFF